MRQVRSAPAGSLVEQVAETLVQALREDLARQARFRIALAGGSTPRALYERLAQPDYRSAVNWERVRFFWGDERYVPHDHPHSNYRMAYEAWLKPLSLPKACLNPMPTDCEDPDECAHRYESLLRAEFYGSGSAPIDDTERGQPVPPPRFDLILLGMGDDGHTASLFPGDSALQERVRWVVPAIAPFEPHQRLTLTLPVLNRARRVWFLVTGESKRTILQRVFAGEPFPANAVQPEAGECVWWLDEALV
ncbi:MAG: 6-phosphogluconolactonase [Fimbriimonadales bacterium]